LLTTDMTAAESVAEKGRWGSSGGTRKCGPSGQPDGHPVINLGAWTVDVLHP
jgi:hypothetical protein